MNRDVYHTIIFHEQAPVPTRASRTSKLSRLPFLNLSNTNSQFTGKNALYLLENAVGRIYQVLRYIELSGPYLDKYGPIIKEMPTMYKLMKAFNELENESTDSKSGDIQVNKHKHFQYPKQSTPKLYI